MIREKCLLKIHGRITFDYCASETAPRWPFVYSPENHLWTNHGQLVMVSEKDKMYVACSDVSAQLTKHLVMLDMHSATLCCSMWYV